MKQLISYYRMPGDREEEISRLIFTNHCGNASQVLALLDGFL